MGPSARLFARLSPWNHRLVSRLRPPARQSLDRLFAPFHHRTFMAQAESRAG